MTSSDVLVVIFEHMLHLFSVSVVDFKHVNVSWVTNIFEPCSTRQKAVTENGVNYFF